MPTCLGLCACRSAKRGTAVGVMWATAWQCGQVMTRFSAWSWIRCPYASICTATISASGCVPGLDGSRMSRCSLTWFYYVFLCRRRTVAGEGQDLVGDSSVFAAEMMALADGLAGDPVREVRADGVLVTLAVQAQHPVGLAV